MCNAHLLHALQALTEENSHWAQAADLLRQRYRQILRQADEEEPPPKVKQGKGRPKNTAERNLLKRLQQYEESVLAFALVAGVPFINSLAERDLRPAKVK